MGQLEAEEVKYYAVLLDEILDMDLFLLVTAVTIHHVLNAHCYLRAVGLLFHVLPIVLEMKTQGSY